MDGLLLHQHINEFTAKWAIRGGTSLEETDHWGCGFEVVYVSPGLSSAFSAPLGTMR